LGVAQKSPLIFSSTESSGDEASTFPSHPNPIPSLPAFGTCSNLSETTAGFFLRTAAIDDPESALFGTLEVDVFAYSGVTAGAMKGFDRSEISKNLVA
jgi:hypothetical protein